MSRGKSQRGLWVREREREREREGEGEREKEREKWSPLLLQNSFRFWMTVRCMRHAHVSRSLSLSHCLFHTISLSLWIHCTSLAFFKFGSPSHSACIILNDLCLRTEWYTHPPFMYHTEWCHLSCACLISITYFVPSRSFVLLGSFRRDTSHFQSDCL